MKKLENGDLITTPLQLRRYVWVLVILWTVAIGVVLAWELLDEQAQATAIARNKAHGIWKKEDAIYRWAASHGGVYIPIQEEAGPDPRLASVSEQNLTMPSGDRLRLVSPATIMRQIFTTGGPSSFLQGHVASLRPIDPRNAPDSWEEKALQAFASGQPEFSSKVTVDGQQYLRLMRPLITEPSCLSCHVEREYKPGDIRGGLSVSVSMSSGWDDQEPEMVRRIAGYGSMWAFGLCGILLMSRRLQQQMDRRCEAEINLQEANNMLERRVMERTAELAEANRELQNEVAERRRAEQWLMESEQRFRGYFEQGLVGMAILSAEWDWVEVNGRLARMFGYTEEELFLTDWKKLAHPDDRAAVDSQFQRLVEGVAKGFVTDARFLRKDGRAFHAGLSVQYLKKPDGTVDCVLVLMQETVASGERNSERS